MKRAVATGKRALTALVAFVLALMFALTTAVAMLSAFSFTSAHAEDVFETVTEKGVKKYIISDVRVTPVSDTVVRLEEKGANGFEDRETYYVPGREDFASPSSSAKAEGGEVVISAGEYIVHVPDDADSLAGVYVTDKDNITLYQYNGVTLANTYLPSPSDDIRGWYFSDYPRLVPGDNGYSIVKGVEKNGWDFTDRAVPDVYVFVPQNYTQFCEDFVTLTGKSNLVELKDLGYWDSRWVVYNDEMALQQIQDYLDRGYSIDVLVIDTNWRKGDVNQTPGMDPAVGGMGYEIDKDLFPNMKEFLEKAHEMGVNIIFNDHPEPTEGNTNGLEEKEVEFRSESLKGILSLGLDMWWYDRNWHTALNSADPDLSVFAWGMYAFQFIENEEFEEIARDSEEANAYARRAIIMGNVDGCLHGNWKYGSDISAHRYTIQWTGDIGSDEHALGMEIRDAIFGGAENGIPYVSSDLGGHTSPVTDDLYTRWLQYGALSTITRVHCTNVAYLHQEGRMPWLFGDTAEEVTKEYVGMKYNLMPLYYTLAAENSRTGLPIMRRLDVKYPQYKEASRNDEYLLGDGILIAPLNEASVKVAFPEDFFFHTEKGKRVNGLLGSYYNNASHTGNPVYTQSDTSFLLDWGQASPKNLPADNFSVKWEGSFTVGSVDMRFSFFADDRVQVWIDDLEVVNSYDEETQSNSYDTLFTTDYYKAGTTHTIEIRYVEEGNYAHFNMYGTERSTLPSASFCYDSREVFLPDGVWIDVWSGKEYEGPFTYTVTHPLETSPVFVRKGILNVLAPDMKNLNEKDWSKLTLDAYPAAFRTETSLYEDDTTTQAYKDGHYRITPISAEAKNGAYTITIGAAEGSFEGKRAVTERVWNVRLHVYEELGDITGVTLNGKDVTGLSYFTRDSKSSPFSFTGASADTAVYEFSFTAKVDEESEIVVHFEHDNKLTSLTKNSSYDATPAEFTVGEAKEIGGYLDLDNASFDDWAFFGTETARKGNAEHVIGEITSDFELHTNENAALTAGWTHGEGLADSVGASACVRGQVDVNVTLKVKAGETKVFTLFLVSEQCVGKLTVRDRAGNVSTVILDGTVGTDGLTSSNALNKCFNGTSARKVAIAVTADEDTEIYVRYSVHSSRKDGGAGTDSAARVGIAAIVCADAEAECASLPDVTVKNPGMQSYAIPSSVNLSEVPSLPGVSLSGEVLDWVKTNAGDGFVHMEGGSSIGDVMGGKFNPFGDFKGSFSWTNGEETETGSGSTTGYHTDSNQSFTVTFRVDENVKYIVLYAGAWKGTNTVTLYNANGEQKALDLITAGEDSVCRCVVIPIEATSPTIVTVTLSSRANDNGNASLAAVQVIG